MCSLLNYYNAQHFKPVSHVGVFILLFTNNLCIWYALEWNNVDLMKGTCKFFKLSIKSTLIFSVVEFEKAGK